MRLLWLASMSWANPRKIYKGNQRKKKRNRTANTQRRIDDDRVTSSVFLPLVNIVYICPSIYNTKKAHFLKWFWLLFLKNKSNYLDYIPNYYVYYVINHRISMILSTNFIAHRWQSYCFYLCFLLRFLQCHTADFQCSHKDFIVEIHKRRLERILGSLRGIVVRNFCEIFLSNHWTALDTHWYAPSHPGCNTGLIRVISGFIGDFDELALKAAL